jgi:hypothetical protein
LLQATEPTRWRLICSLYKPFRGGGLFLPACLASFVVFVVTYVLIIWDMQTRM